MILDRSYGRETAPVRPSRFAACRLMYFLTRDFDRRQMHARKLLLV
jgi:hypothetical protein